MSYKEIPKGPDGFYHPASEEELGRRKRPAPISGERASGLSFDGLVGPLPG